MIGADERLHILQHALGLDRHGKGRQYRNHFVTGPGSSDFENCLVLVFMGLMERHPPSVLTGGSDCFTVTEEGMRFVGQHSPKPPKLTRSQQRYRDFLRQDSGLRFGDWIKSRTSRAPTP